MNDDRFIFPDNYPDHEPQTNNRMAKRFNNPPKKSRVVKNDQDPEYLTALARLVDATNYRPGLTAKQQFTLELLKAYVAANGGVGSQSVKQAMQAAEQVFGEH